ncbi:hypothetical protein JYG30_13460 [Fibrella sp. USSR17]
MNQVPDLPTDNVSGQATASSSTTGSHLRVSNSQLQFDRTPLGEESFLTLKVTPPYSDALVVLTISEPDMFQVAAGKERLAFKQALTVKPDLTGSYIHLRYTPTRSGKHQATLTLEAPASAETITVQLAGRTTGVALLTQRTQSTAGYNTSTGERPGNWLAKGLLGASILAGLGIGVYAFRCDIWPASCGPVVDNAVPTIVPEQTGTTNAPVAKNRPLPATRTSKTRPVPADVQPTPPVEAAEPVVTQNEPITNLPDQRTPVPTRPVLAESSPRVTKAAPKSKLVGAQRTQPVPKLKPVPKPAPSEESDLERELNRTSQ